jgi:hypothetical protein
LRKLPGIQDKSNSQAVKSIEDMMAQLKNTAAHYWDRLDGSWRFAIIAFIAARLFFALWSWVIFMVQPVAVQNFAFSGEPIVSIFKLETSERYVFRRDVNGEILTFQPANTQQLVDRETGSLWTISNGVAVQGPYTGSTLARAQTSPDAIFPYEGVPPYPGMWLGMWQRFDANWYLSIAERGYGHIAGDVHFPPLYPLLVRTLRPLFGNPFLAGLFLSQIATLYALKLLHDLFHAWGDPQTAKRALVLFILFPTFFFCFSAYTEPVFLVTALLSLRAMKSHSWVWAGFWIFCSILIRLQGVALLAPMLYLMWYDTPFLRKPAHWVGSIIAGIGGLLYLYVRSQSPSQEPIPFVESDLHARLVAPWQSYWYAVKTIVSGNATFIDVLNWSVVTIVICLLIIGWKKVPAEYGIYTVLSLLIIMTRMVETQPLTSMVRYSLTFFPMFFVLSDIGENPILRRVILYVFIPLSLYLSGQFFLWGWVG